LKCVLISHMHTDHALNLHAITTRHIREKHGRVEPLRVYAPKGSFDILLDMNKLFYGTEDEITKERYRGFVEFIELEDGMSFVEGEYTITAYKMEHGKPETFGFVFKDKKGVVVGFSADTKVCVNLHKILEQSNYAFVEMSATKELPTHISTKEFVELVKKYDKVKMYPVHTSDSAQEFAVQNGLNYLEDGSVLEF